jgi:hypothetical protein
VVSQLLYSLVSEAEPQYTAYRLVVYFALPLLALAASYFVLLRKRNLLDHLALVFALTWLVVKGIAFYSDNVSVHWIDGMYSNVFAVIWFLGYVTSKRCFSLIKSHGFLDKLLLDGLIIFGSLVLLVVFSVVFIILAEMAYSWI